MSSDSSDLSPRPSRRYQPLKALLMLGLVAALFVMSSLAGSLIASLYYHVTGQATNLSESTSFQFMATVAVYALLLWSVTKVFRRFFAVDTVQAGLQSPRWTDPIWAAVALPVYYVAYGVVVLLVIATVPGFNAGQQQQIGFNGAHGLSQLLMVFISLVVVPSLVEETVMRGYLYGGLKKVVPRSIAVLLTSLLFAVGHLEFGSGGPLVWVAALFTFILALVLTVLREKTGRIWAGVCLHALVNGISFYFLFVAK